MIAKIVSNIIRHQLVQGHEQPLIDLLNHLAKESPTMLTTFMRSYGTSTLASEYRRASEAVRAKFEYLMPEWYDIHVHAVTVEYLSNGQSLEAAQHIMSISKLWDTSQVYGLTWTKKVIDDIKGKPESHV